jgi:uncharacterized protein
MRENKLQTSRRHFLKTTLTLPVTLAAVPAIITQNTSAEDKPATAAAALLPKRQMGKSGPQATMLCLGGMEQALSPDYLDIAWSLGIRYFDTADCYLNGRSEKIFARWLAKYPERRQEIFLVSKDHPHQGPKQLLEMIDRRLEACGTKYLDAFYIHGIGPGEYGDASLNWPRSDEFKKAAETLKSSGKVKMVGFSCHDGRLNDYLNAAAQGGFLDIIMLRYSPFFKKGEAFDQALDAAHQAGIALVAMKTLRSAGKDIPKRVPEFDKLGLTTHQTMLHAVWSDPRISVACCQLDNVGQMQQGAAAAASYKTPLKLAHLNLLRETLLASRRTFCPGCPSCDAFAAASEFALLDIARFVAYYEQDGLVEAREFYHALLAVARNANGVDLAALRDRCAFGVDYPEIVKRAERNFA